MRKRVLMIIVMLAYLLTFMSFGMDVEHTIRGRLHKKDSICDHVEALEEALSKAGYMDANEVDEYFGNETEKAVMQFQQDNELAVDGIVGPITLGVLSDKGLIGDIDTFEEKTMVSRNMEREVGQYLPWNQVYDMFTKQESIVKIKDFYTGLTFELLITYGHNHFDVEPLTSEDSKTIKSVWGGEYSWARRPVLVYYEDQVLAASMNGMPHAGLEAYSAGEYVSDRSGGFGYGYNYDFVKNNNFEGVVCLHFQGSKLHANNKSDNKHQNAVKVAAGLR